MLFTQVGVLTGNYRKTHGASVAVRGRGAGPADTARVTLRVGEAVPVNVGSFEVPDQDATSPIGGGQDPSARVRDNAREGFVLGDFDDQSCLASRMPKRSGSGKASP